jgi:hypothetical protein
MRVLILTTLVWILASPATSIADNGPFRCSGVVQHRPCGQPIATGPKRYVLAVNPNGGTGVRREPATPGAFLRF